MTSEAPSLLQKCASCDSAIAISAIVSATATVPNSR